jgi:peroxiredoxin
VFQTIRRTALAALARLSRRPTAEAALRAGVIVSAALALLLAIVSRGLASPPSDAQRLAGHTVPQITLPAVQDGRLLPQPVALTAQDGHPTLLLFTYTLCPHCLGAAQTVQQLQHIYAARGLRVVYIDSPAEATRIVAAYQQRLDLRDPVLLDARGSVAERFGVHAYPAVVLIDARGVIRHIETGETSLQTLQREIDGVVP